MAGGRPRTVSFTEDEMVRLGEEMVQWVKENKPIHLSMWYTMEKGFTDEQWDTFRKRVEFIHYYNTALKLVGYNYLEKSSEIEPSLKQRWQRVYFKDLRSQEDQDKAYESELRMKEMEHAVKLRKEEVLSYTEEQAERHKCLLDMLKDYQSALLSDSTSNSTESKS